MEQVFYSMLDKSRKTLLRLVLDTITVSFFIQRTMQMHSSGRTLRVPIMHWHRPLKLYVNPNNLQEFTQESRAVLKFADNLVISKLIAKEVMNSLFVEIYRPDDNCSCLMNNGTLYACLTDSNYFIEINQITEATTASHCFKRDFLTFLAQNPSRIQCVFDPVFPENSSLSICGNGILEAYEDCECFFNNDTCHQECDIRTCLFPKEEQSWTQNNVISTVVIVIVLVFVFLPSAVIGDFLF